MSKRYTEEEFIDAVRTCYSIASALHKIGLKSTGANYDLFRLRVKKLGLSIDHFTGQNWNGGKKLGPKITRIPTEEICVEESTYTSTHSLKKRLLEELLLVNICYECGIDTWNDKPLVLQLDHINGDHRDNRIENLRMICPNCHSQTHTFAGKNKKSVLTNKCISCETLIRSDRKYCKPCFEASQYKMFSKDI